MGERGGGDFELTQTTHRRCFTLLGLIFFLLVVVLPLVCCQVFHPRISIHTDPPLSAKQRSPAKVVSPPHDKNPSHPSIPMLDFQPGLTQHSTTPGLFKEKKYLEYWKKDFYCLLRLLVASLSVLCHPASSRILGRG